jgi:hypothetical protein
MYLTEGGTIKHELYNDEDAMRSALEYYKVTTGVVWSKMYELGKELKK